MCLMLTGLTGWIACYIFKNIYFNYMALVDIWFESLIDYIIITTTNQLFQEIVNSMSYVSANLSAPMVSEEL